MSKLSKLPYSAFMRRYAALAGFLLLAGIALFLVASFVVRFFVVPPVNSITLDYAGRDVVIQVVVLNGNGVGGTARTVMNYLRSRGFDVVEIDNFIDSTGTISHAVERSFVIDRIGDSLSSVFVAKALGIPEERILRQVDSSLFVHSSVVLGSDYQELLPFR